MTQNMRLTLNKAAEILALVGDDDETLLADSLEGETGLFELLDHFLARLAEEEGMEEAILGRMDLLKDRVLASRGVQERLRSALQACLEAGGLKTIRRPEGTLTLSQKKPGILAVDEAQLPERFFKVKREVSRSAINDALRDGEAVPGVTLSNGGVGLTVRRG